MPGETAPIRALTRRVKDKSLQEAEKILNNPQDFDPELWKSTFLTVLKNAVPRATEISGEDGTAIQVQITGMKIIQEQSGGDRVQDTQPQTA